MNCVLRVYSLDWLFWIINYEIMYAHPYETSFFVILAAEECVYRTQMLFLSNKYGSFVQILILLTSQQRSLMAHL